MSDALDRRERLAEYSGERGSTVLVTARRNALGATLIFTVDWTLTYRVVD